MAKGKTRGTVAVAVVAALAFLCFAFFRSAAPEAAYPFERAKASFSRRVLSRIVGLWRGSAAMAENVRLRREAAALALERSEYARVMGENERLRRELGFCGGAAGKWIAAEVLSTGGGAAAVRRTARAGKGSLDGVREGAVVEVPDGLVGQVVSVTPHTCEILLATDPSLKVACTIHGETKLRGILSGGVDDGLVVNHIRGGADIPPRAKVCTSGLGGVFPAGIEIGSFDGGCPSADSARERSGKVVPSVDFQNLEDVFIRR